MHHVHRGCHFSSPRLTARIYRTSECHCERSIPHIEDDTVVVAQSLSKYTPDTSWRWRPPREQASPTASSRLRSKVDAPVASACLLPILLQYLALGYYAEAPYKHGYYSGDSACINISTFSWLLRCLKHANRTRSRAKKFADLLFPCRCQTASGFLPTISRDNLYILLSTDRSGRRTDMYAAIVVA